MSTEKDVSPRPSFLARFWRVIIRVIFVIIIGILLGVGAFFGSSALYRQFIQPVQEHSLRLNALEDRIEQTSQGQSQRLEDLASRLDTLEAQGDSHRESLADLQTRLESLEEAQTTQAAALTTTIEDASSLQKSLSELRSSIDSAEESLDALEGDVRAAKSGLEAAEDSFDTISERVGENDREIQDLTALVERETARWEAMQRELQVLRVMELISRSRFFLAQNNLSLAQSDIRAGRDLLLGLENEVAASQAGLIVEAISRLEAALEDLPRAPVSAADELEGAWQLLLQGLPAPPTPTPTTAAAPTSPTVSPTPTPTQGP